MQRAILLGSLFTLTLFGTIEAQIDRRVPRRPLPRPVRLQAETPRVVVLRAATERSKHLPKLDARSLKRIVSSRGTRVVTERTRADDLARHRENAARHRRELERLAGADRKRLSRLLRGSEMDARREPSTAFRTRSGQRRRVPLLHRDALIRDVLVTNAALRDRDLRARTYAALHANAARSLGADARSALARLPDPRKVAGAPLAEIDRAITRIVDLWITGFVWVDTGPPANRPASCSAEEGDGFGGDRSGPGPGFDANGLFSNASWPLKWYQTCIKDQGSRGTCAAFAITAAAESSIAFQRGRWVNLSEQDLYKHMRLDWAPLPPDFYGDGFVPPVSLLFQVAGGYTFPWERDWDYNPSPSRQANDATRTYSNSCDGYAGEACSDTNHQSNLTCYVTETRVVKEVVSEVCHFVEGIPLVGLLGEWVCDSVTETIETVEQVEVCVYDTAIPGTSNLRVSSFVPFYAPFVVSPQVGVDLARAHLAAGMPVVFSFETVPTFDAATGEGGYVEFAGEDEESRGGHCVLLTGFVANEDLPANVPQAQGGGWFILRNSWGEDWGDMGHAYVSARWVRQWATQMSAITGIAGS